MRKIIVGTVLLAMLASARAQTNVADEVIWVIGEEAILRSDVEEARIEAQTLGQRLDGDPYCVLPEQLAIQKLFLHQAAIDSVEVTDNEVLQAVETRINYYIQQLGSREKMEEYFNKTTLQIREQLFDIVRNDNLVSEVRSNLVKNIKVTPAQVRRYLKDLPVDSIPFIPTQYEVQILVREPVVRQEEIDRVKNQLRDFTSRINAGESTFASLAVLYSEDRGTAMQGGETGLMERMKFVPEFATAAFNLTDPKAVSKIIETEYGFHILQLIEKRGDRVNVRHILMKPRVSDDDLTAALAQMDSIMDGVTKGLYTFDEAVTMTSQDKDSRANYGIMMNPADPRDNDLGGTSRFQLKDLPSEVARKIAGMKVGELSQPFIMVNKSNKEVVAVVRLKNKVDGHRATMQDDYQVLQNALIEQLSERKLDSWIKEMQRTTYIRINDDWKHCEFKYPGWIKE